MVKMSTVPITGGRLRELIQKRGIRQKELVEWTGVNKQNVSRWCREGISNIKTPHVLAISRGLGVSFEKLLEECGVRGVHVCLEDRLSPAEAELLEVFRGCSELDRARIRVAVHELISQLNEQS